MCEKKNEMVAKVSKVASYSWVDPLLACTKNPSFNLYLRKEEYERQSHLIKNKELLIQEIKNKIATQLTMREIECLSLSLIGFSAKQIGARLEISYRTVETHLQQSLYKLDCFSKLHCLETMLERSCLSIWQDLAMLILKD